MDDKAAIKALAALAHESRLRIFKMLVAAGPSGVRAGEIGVRLGIAATSLSFHLKELDNANLVHSAREGRYVRYAINIEGVRRLLTFLTEDCCQGQPELCGSAFHTPMPDCCAQEQDGA